MIYTPDSLLEIAVQAGKDYENNIDRLGNYYLEKDAFSCASYMESNDIKEASNIGPFNSHGIKAGDKVRVKMGSKLGGYNLHSEFARKSYVVTVSRISNGEVVYDVTDEAPIDVINAQVTWSGKNGWVWTDINNVEKVSS